MQRTLKFAIGGLLGLLLGLIAAGLLFLQTEAGGRAAARALAILLSAPGEMELSIEAIEPGLPSRLELSGLKARDAEGEWLAVDRLSIDWRPLALLRGRISVREAAAEGVRLARLPGGEADVGETPAGLPTLPLDLEVDTFSFEDVRIGSAIAGEPVDLRAYGRLAAVRAGEIETKAHIVRTDGVGGGADLAATWIPSSRELTVEARLDEPQGGLIGQALGLAGRPPVRVQLTGSGPVGEWRGAVSGHIGDGVRLDADVRSEPSPAGTTMHITGRADLAPLLDEASRALAEGGIGFELALRRPDGPVVHIDALWVEAGAIRLTGTGLIDVVAGQIDQATIRLAAADASALAPLLAPASLDTLNVEADLAGSWTRPTIDARGKIIGLRLSGRAAGTERAEWTARLAPLAPAGERVALRATADLYGLQTGAADIAAMLGGSPRLSLDAVFDRETNRLTVEQARMETPALVFSGGGRVELATGDGAATLDGAIRDFAVLRGLTGLDLAGRADFAVEGDAGDGRFQATFGIEAEALRTGLATVDAVLGPRPRLRGQVSGDTEGRSIRLGGVVVEGHDLQAEASAELAGGAVSADYRVRVPDLGPAAAAAGVLAEGALDLAGTLAGDAADPSASATLRLDDARVAGVNLSAARADINAATLVSAPSGTLKVTAAVDGDPVRARVPFERGGEGGLRLGPFEATAPGASASGALRLPASGGPVLGDIILRTGDEGKAAALAGWELAGRSEATIRLGAQGGEQTVDIEASGRSLSATSLSGSAGSAESVSMQASLAGPPGAMRGTAVARAKAVNVGGAVIDAVEANVQGAQDSGAFDITARLPGVAGDEIRGAGTLSRSGDRTDVVVRSLEGQIGGEALALRRPLRIGRDGSSIRIDSLDLAIGEGGIGAEGRSGESGTEASFIASDVPLGVAAALRPDLELDGTIDARGSLRTDGGRLTGDAVVDVDNLRTGTMTLSSALDATATVRLEGESLAVEASSVIAGERLHIAARVPASVDPRTLALRLPPQAPLSGRLSWAGPVGGLWELLPLSDQRLTGQADIDLRLAGTLAAPRIEGALTLSDGRYENFITATVIEDLEAAARARGSGMVVLSLRGTDGERGTISGDGTLTLVAGAQPLVDLGVRFNQATLVRRDDVSATVSGEMDLRRTANEMRIGGLVRTDRVEVRLIDRLPPSVVVLDVKEINLPPGVRRPEAAQQPAPALIFDLDLRVDMPRRVFVRGRGLESEWEGQLRVSGTTADPALVGTVSLRSGVFDFAGRRFTIERGEIGFAGGKSIDPALNVVAVREAAEITAQIAVTGTASQPKIALSSQPVLPDSEILARVLFGKDVAKLGPIELAQLGMALDTLASGESLSDDALNYVRNLLGLDVLTVETGGDDGDGPALGVGRYVADGVYVGARQGVQDDSTAGTLEVEILPGLAVESEVGSTAEGAAGALGLRWRWDY